MLPSDDPCQWLPVDDVADLMEAAGADLADGSSVETTADPLGASAGRAECWYSASGDPATLTVSLVNEAGDVANWQVTIDQLLDAPSGVIEDASVGFRDELGEIDTLPAVMRSYEIEDRGADCAVVALTGGDGFVTVDLGVDGADDGTALCSFARDATTTVLDRLRG